MEGVTSPEGIVAVAGAGVAVVSLILGVVLAIKLGKLRADQKAVLGDADRDLVEHAARIETAFIELRDWVEEASGEIDSRMAAAERRIDGSFAHVSVVRYDAYGEMSGRQSSSIALLDTRRSGVVMSSILHRDNARVYVKRVIDGSSEHELSPEENEAIETALAGGRRPGEVAS